MATPLIGRFFEEFSLNETFLSDRHTISSDDVVAFANITGDTNPLHLSIDESRRLGYEKQVVHGLLGVSLSIGLLTSLGLFNKTAVALLSLDEWKFHRPIFVGAEVVSRMVVIGLRESASRPDNGILTRRLSLESVDGTLLIQGVATMLVMRKSGGTSH
jgi:acyl dehydratase